MHALRQFRLSNSFSISNTSFFFINTLKLRKSGLLPDFFIDPAGTGYPAYWKSGTGLSGLPDIRYTSIHGFSKSFLFSLNLISGTSSVASHVEYDLNSSWVLKQP